MKNDLLRLDSSTTRLSFSPSRHWTFRLSRGAPTELDQLTPVGEVRRTAIAATYSRSRDDGDWQTTFAWGRNARKLREPTTGYLVESIIRFNGQHTVFGRVEQVGSDDLLQEKESQRRSFTLNKLSLGYIHAVSPNALAKMDIGALVSRHIYPSSVGTPPGNDPVSYLLFLRVKLH